ncbi:MAG: AAA family ATPase [Candidatus Dechloromonas phosphoritropha]|jgi:type II secretory pathway predicted ATPase ExeA
MNLNQILRRHRITQMALAAGAGLSRGVVYRLLAHGEWPRRDPAARERVGAFLQANGIDRRLATVLMSGESGHEKAPDVLTHAEANPEASINETQEESMLLRNENLTPATRQHFGLPRSPFVDDVTTRDDVFSSAATRYVRAALYDAALNHGFIAIIGESGSGKSTLVEELEQRILDEDKQVIIIRPYILGMEENDTKGKTLKSSQIEEAIIRTLAPSATPKRTPDARGNQVKQLLVASRSAGYSHLLVIEEAHCLPVVTLKHLKRFREIKRGLATLLGVCLVGQPELDNRLSDRNHEVREAVQRCERIELPPLDNDLEAYLKHKFERLGAKIGDVLAADACDALRARLIRLPRGGKASDASSLCYPLVVNNLVARAMNAAAAAGWPKVDAQVIGGC